EATPADSATRVDLLDGEERSLVHPFPRRLAQRAGEAEADDVGLAGRGASDQDGRRGDQREGTERRMATARAAAGRVDSNLHRRGSIAWKSCRGEQPEGNRPSAPDSRGSTSRDHSSTLLLIDNGADQRPRSSRP